MNAAAINTKTEEQGCCLKIDFLPIVQSMFNKTTAYDAHLVLSANELGSVSYKTLRPIAERTDINIQLEQWIFEKSCRMVSDMIRNDVKFDYVSVNVSVRYLKMDRIPADIIGMTPLGLVQLTRRKQREPLNRLLQQLCPNCKGVGRVNIVAKGAAK